MTAAIEAPESHAAVLPSRLSSRPERWAKQREITQMAKKVRKGPQAARAVREGFPADVLVGPSAYHLYGPERIQRIIQKTRYLKPLPVECQPGGARLLELRRSLGIATVELADLVVTDTASQLARLRSVQRAATNLQQRLETVDDGWNAWAEVRLTMDREKHETGKDTPWHQSPIDAGAFPWVVRKIAEFVAATHDRISSSASKSTADIDRYVDALARAYEAFFGEEPGYSTAKKDQKSRIGAFIRFAQAVAAEANIELSAEQITKRVKKRRKRRRNLASEA
jgi:hypothetical protein